ncbi:hypothetical protein [Thiobacillus sp.]|uniref:hypothetical protein n=1 Tax=Thiobacillus sp. TaxID=924 RepID=UPI0025E61696|nr:hypothetical protein [Thiobacillus sp.]
MPLTKLRILTYRMTGAERRFSLRTLVALSSLPLFGVVAAFGLAPDTTTTTGNRDPVGRYDRQRAGPVKNRRT